MAINFYGRTPESKQYEFAIQAKSLMPGLKGKRSNRRLLVKFDYFGLEKELVVDPQQREKVVQAGLVTATIGEGL